MWHVVFGVCHAMDCAFTVSVVLVRSGMDSSMNVWWKMSGNYYVFSL